LDRQGFASKEAYVDWLVAKLEDAIVKEGSDTIATFVAEPIIAVSGLLISPQTYFPKITQMLDKYRILLVIDDVVCSSRRIGHWFGWGTTRVTPDLVSVTKIF